MILLLHFVAIAAFTSLFSCDAFCSSISATALGSRFSSRDGTFEVPLDSRPASATGIDNDDDNEINSTFSAAPITVAAAAITSSNSDNPPGEHKVNSASGGNDDIAESVQSAAKKETHSSSSVNQVADARVPVRLKDIVDNANSAKSKQLMIRTSTNNLGGAGGGAAGAGKARLARATASLQAKRKQKEQQDRLDDNSRNINALSANKSAQSKIKRYNDYYYTPIPSTSSTSSDTSYLIDLKKKIDQKIMRNNWNRTGQRRRVNDNTLQQSSLITSLPQRQVHVQHETDSMQSLLGYNHFEGEWSDRNSTTYHVAIVFGKGLINDQISIEYATRIRTLVKMLKGDDGENELGGSFRPKLICFTGGSNNHFQNSNNGGSSGNSGGSGTENSIISDAAAGYVYFRHLCASQNIHIDSSQTNIWVDKRNGCNARDAMERVASELWRKYIKTWLKERPLTERLNQHYGVGWHILERRVDIHFTLISTEYHLCNMNDVHHRSPGKSFLQPLVSLRGLVGSDRWVNKDELEVMDPGYRSSVHMASSSSSSSSSRNTAPSISGSGNRANFAGIENSVDTSWSFQYGTYPFLHGKEDSIVFLGQCYLLGEELTPLLVNMKGVVEQTEFFQRDNYLLLTSIRRSLVSLVEALYTDKGQSIRAGLIKYFECQGRNRFTKEDVKIIVLLESALLNLGRCIDLVKPAGLLAGSVPATTWARALDALEKSMHNIQIVCDPDQPLDPNDWGKL